MSYFCIVFWILWNTVFVILDNVFRVLKSKFKRLKNLPIVLVNDLFFSPVHYLKSLIVSVSRLQVMVLDCHPSSQTHRSFLSHSGTCTIKTANKRFASTTCGLQSRGLRRETGKPRVHFKFHLDFLDLHPFSWMCVAHSYPADPPPPEGRHGQKLGGTYVNVSVL